MQHGRVLWALVICMKIGFSIEIQKTRYSFHSGSFKIEGLEKVYI